MIFETMPKSRLKALLDYFGGSRIPNIPPAEAEESYYAHAKVQALAA